VNRHRRTHCLKLASLGVLLMANPLFAQTVQYAYDKDGRLTQATRDDGIVDTYQYDVANNLIKNTGVADNTASPFSLTDYTPKSAIVGATITITGKSFSNPTVSFNGTPATVTSSTDTSLTVAVPTGATSGPLTVTVGGQTLTAGAFNVLVNPNAFSVADFTPKSAAIGDSFTLTGTGFTNPTVTINGTPATVTASTATSITVTVPPGATSGPVIVMVGGQSQTVGTFTVTTPVPSFTVTDFTPRSAPVGSAVTISGTGFTNPTVAFNGIAAPVTNITDTGITATVPVGATSGPLTVTVGNQTQEAGTFTVASAVAPVLTAYSLPVAQAGDTITITGSNFDISSPDANVVKVGGIRASVTAVSATQLTFGVPPFSTINNPPGTPGTAQTVTVQTAAGITTAPKPLYLVPRIIFNKPFSPTSTAFGDFTAPGDNGILLAQSGQYNVPVQGININGSGRLNLFVFDASNTLIQTIQAPTAPFRPRTNGTLQESTGAFTLPSGGPYVIQTVFETDPNLGFQATGTLNFGLLPFLVTGITPQSGFIGDSVTINGSGFVNPTVAFNGIPAIVTTSSSTSITVTIPRGATSGSLTVTSESITESAGLFTVQPFKITGISETFGVVGDSITITGSDFVNPTVAFNDIPAIVTTSSSTSITVTVPSGKSTGRIVVTDQGVSQNAGYFTLIPFRINGFSPQSVFEGDSLIITGSGFSNPIVYINGIPATVTASTSTSITATIPAGAVSISKLDVQVGNDVYFAGYLEVIPFRITGFSPQTGLAGDSVIITGRGFSNPTVKFNGLLATVIDKTATGITVTVPSGKSAGLLVVTDQEVSQNAGYFLFSLATSSNLYTFNGTDGANPFARLLQASDGSFYGTNYRGGTTDQGNIFRVAPDGTLTVFHSFNGTDGLKPNELIQANDGNFYGTTKEGGAYGNGTIFRVTSNGTFTTLYSFNGIDGNGPRTGLTQANDGALYGTTYAGGTYGKGTLFRSGIDGTLTTVYAFGNETDAANPSGHLIQAKDGELYGTTEAGGSEGSGTVYRITLAGSETILKRFGGGDGSVGVPVGGVVQSGDGTFYGTLSSAVEGQVFRLALSGSLTYFGPISGNPTGGLIQASDGNFYGTTTSGGSKNLGTAFQIEPNGSFKTLYSFDGQSGSHPFGGVIQGKDGNFYGPAFDGGANNKGTLFKLTPQGLPSITSFSPGSGPIGSAVLITGKNFTDATTVTFNGLPADFTVNSPTQITAVVPPDGFVNIFSSKIFDTNFALLRNKNIAVNGVFSLGTLNATRGKFISLVGARPKLSNTSLRLAVGGGPPPVSASASGLITVSTPNGSTTSLAPFTVTP
jgi:uncharacterized repeat protein (TIGR03803 family)/YD repeat-containing protein